MLSYLWWLSFPDGVFAVLSVDAYWTPCCINMNV
jgi:hypothetical protein